VTSRSSETFDELTDRLGSMYAAGAFDRALSELDEHAPTHPDHDVDVAHLRACFLSLTGRPAEAVAVLDRQLARGGWWAEPLLRFDPDLDGARSIAGFDAIVAESGRRWHAAIAGDRDAWFVLGGSSPVRAVIVVLHGGAGTAGDAGVAWAPAAEAGCTVVVPGRGQPITSTSHQRNWFDPATTDREVAAAVAQQIGSGAGAQTPVLVAGFSAGGREALRIGLSGSPLAVHGLLLFAPGLPQTQPTDAAVRAAAGRGVRVATWIGAEDDRLDRVTEFDGRLRDAGVLVTEEIDPGIGHRMPDDLAERLPGIVSFVLGD
jgi:dienelactone hydrolase